MRVWEGHACAIVISYIILLLILADAVAMAELSASVGHHGKRGCRLLCAFYGHDKSELLLEREIPGAAQPKRLSRALHFP